MQCINDDCKEELEAGADFCPFCGTDQPKAVTAELHTSTPNPLSGEQGLVTPSNVTSTRANAKRSNPAVTGEVLEMRAGEKIWGFTEPERSVKPGQRRALVVMDEQTVHLAHTDQHLAPEELLQRVRRILEEQQVPVDLQLVGARWASDTRNVRPRLIAFLRNHSFSDIKMIMGVDYMGRWASIQLHLAAEPEPIAPPPAEPKSEPNYLPLIAIGVGVLLLFMAFVGGGAGSAAAALFFGFLGVCLLVAGVIWAVINFNQQAAQAAARRNQWQREQQQRANERQAERLFRSFKIDDMRLFCTAMREVFQAVVDDIVQRGGEIVRVEGGKGGYFEAAGAGQPSLAARQSDATAAGI